MTTKIKPPKLNIPSDNDSFAEVAFVNDMNPNQLKTLVKRFWNNIQSLANVLDTRRKDISNVLDEMLDGVKWSEKEIDERFVYTFYKNSVLRYDSLLKQTAILDENFQVIVPPIQGLTTSEIKERRKAK